jgi:putative methyltransferase (TIGR04325 family)
VFLSQVSQHKIRGVKMTDKSMFTLGLKIEPPYFFPPFDGDPQTSDPWTSQGWASNCKAHAEMLGKNQKQRFSLKSLARHVLYGHAGVAPYLLPIHKKILEILKRKSSVRILDIGGGFGDNYQILSESLRRFRSNIEYFVVDNENNCEMGKSLNPGCHFSVNVPDELYDIIIIVGTLQYILDWKSYLEYCQNIGDIIYIARSPIRTSGPTFRAKQAICPPFGELALKNVGVADLVVIGQGELRQAFSKWTVVLAEEYLSYSANFARFDAEFQNISYFNFMWQRSDIGS